MTQPAFLSNPFYAALTTANAPFALAHGLARRFQPGIIPFAAVLQPSAAAYRDLVPLLTIGEEIYITTEAGEAPEPTDGLSVVSVLPGLQMRFGDTALGDEPEPGVIALTADDVPEMLALKERAFPGFFGPRAAELGTFFGVRHPGSGRLLAMGGERLATFSDREVSAVCTDPEHLGQGYAARIVRSIVRHQHRLGCSSLLHVTAGNQRAISLYERLGFCLTGRLDFVKLRRDDPRAPSHI